MKNQIVKFVIDDFHVRTEGDLVSLNDIYKAAMSPKDKKRPNEWMRNADAAGYSLEATKKLLKNNEEFNYAAAAHLESRPEASRGNKRLVEKWAADSFNLIEKWGGLKRKEGKYGGSWANKFIAIEYSGYLSPDLKLKINDTFLRVQSGDTSVIEEALSHQPADKQKRTVDRLQQIVIRNQHTATLQAHGVHGAGFAQCTNATYIPILGGTAAEIREQRGLVKTANLREHMTPIERAAASLSEEISKDKIEKNNLRGNNPCAAACLDASTRVARVFAP